MDVDRPIDRIFGEIADLSRILHEMPRTDVDRRLAIQGQLDDLKQQAKALSAGLPGTRAGLERQIQQLEQAIAAIDRRKINVAGHAGGSPGGDFGFTKDAMDINRAIDENSDRDRLMSRLRDTRAKLARLEEDG